MTSNFYAKASYQLKCIF